MKQPSVYLKMRVLGAVDTVDGRTRHERIHNVAAMTFLDEEGNSRQFTWRTIQTWHYRYKNHGITGMTNRLAQGQRPGSQSRPRGTPRSHQRRQASLPKPTLQQTRPLSLLHRKGTAPRRPHRPDYLLPLHSRVRPVGRRRQRRPQETTRLQHEIRQPTLAGRHHVRAIL